MKTLLVVVSAAAILIACTAPSKSRHPATDSDPAVNGAWTPLVTLRDTSELFPGDHERPRPSDGWWVTPIHVNLLADGRVLVTGWSRSHPAFCKDHQGRQNGTSFVLDPAQLEVSEPTTLAIDPIAEAPQKEGDVLYCSGHSPLPDGRVLFVGGAKYKNLDVLSIQDEFGLNYARAFDPKKRSFERLAHTNPGGPHPSAERRMNGWQWYEQGSMWYPTNTRLPGGQVLVLGGLAKWADVLSSTKYDFLNKSLTLFDFKEFEAGRDPWKVLVEHEAASDDLAIDVFDYGHALLLPKPVKVAGRDRQVAIYGGGKTAWISFLSLDAEVPQNERLARLPNSKRPGVDNAIDTSAALLPSGEILVAGGGMNGRRESQRLDVYNPWTDSWRSYDTGITRRRGSTVLLPDGSVLITNGEDKSWDLADNVGDRKRPQIFDPRAGSVRTLDAWPDDVSDRAYHNIALLLKDGRILIGGGRTTVVENGVEQYRIGCERPDLRVFNPPYLFKGPRPEILDELGEVRAGGPKFTVRFSGQKPRAQDGVVLMALGSQTHAFDQNQRYVPLRFEQAGPDSLTVSPPPNELRAPAGDYQLFLVSDAGVPSVARSVSVKEAGR